MLLALLTLVGDWCGRCYGCLEEERIGLLEIKALTNPNSFYMRDWVEYSSNCCEWHGIECDNTTRRVIRLSLWDARDQSLGDWVLNASLFLPFKELQSLDFSGNGLVGCSENQGRFNASVLVIINKFISLCESYTEITLMKWLAGV